MSEEKDLPLHWLCAIFPPLAAGEFQELAEDIGKNGLLEPIITHDGEILDGRNRYKACLQVGVRPHFQAWAGECGTPEAFVITKNLKRRHLNESQRAMVAARFKDIFAEQNKPGKRKQQEKQDDKDDVLLPSIDGNKNRNTNTAAHKAGALLNVSSASVERAARVLHSNDSEMIDAVESGDLSVTAACQELKHREVLTKAEPLPSTGKYRVFYADPPWQYGNSGLQAYGHAESHYPTMSIFELCEMPVKDISDGNAVLFLWATSPFLEDSFKVINAWGFEYKTSFVWNKELPNFGYYNSVRHEFLLVATKGSCLPEIKTLKPSVVSIRRSKKHSEKPEYFREMIDDLYPTGKRIELFSRTSADGWDTWGNEADEAQQNV